MNLAVDQQHIMQAIDWSRFDLQDWLKQFGLWQNTVTSGGGGVNPIYQAMKRAKVKSFKADKGKLIAYYLCDENFKETPNTKKGTCEITDNEARAVQHLVLDVINGSDSEALLMWMDAIICRYFKLYSWAEMETDDRTVMDAKYDIRCGLAVLHVKHQHIRLTNGKI